MFFLVVLKDLKSCLILENQYRFEGMTAISSGLSFSFFLFLAII